MPYKYIGTKQQLIDNGFEYVYGLTKNADGSYDRVTYNLGVFIELPNMFGVGISYSVEVNNEKLVFESPNDETPHYIDWLLFAHKVVQNLIEKGLVVKND